MNGGERDLATLLADLKPRLHPERYAFAAAAEPVLGPDQFALIREDEGISAIAPDPAGEWARITLEVHSSLEAVGLTAAISSRLAEAGIGANVIAGLHHDHLLIPWHQREEALACLQQRG